MFAFLLVTTFSGDDIYASRGDSVMRRAGVGGNPAKGFSVVRCYGCGVKMNMAEGVFLRTGSDGELRVFCSEDCARAPERAEL